VISIWSNVFDVSWRGYPAAALALAGIALVIRGLWFGVAGKPGLLRQGKDAFAWIRCFQIGIAGIALLGVAAAWYWHQPWLLILALAVLGEEMLETSRILTVLANNPTRPPAPKPPAP
jgi:hypothetical protein